MSNMKKTALYIRSAVEDNDKVKLQEKILGDYSVKHGYNHIQLYVDNGASGNTLDRPALNRLNTDIEAGNIDAVIVEDVSRISRNLVQSSKWINFVQQKGISVIIVR